MDDEDQKFMEEYFKKHIINKIEIQNDKNNLEEEKSDESYDSEDNEYDFSELNEENNESNLINQNKVIIENIQWKYKKIDKIEKLLDKYNVSSDGLLILKNLPKFEELTDEQKYYEMKKIKYKLYKDCKFDKNKYAQQNPNGLFVAGDGKLKKQQMKNKRKNKNFFLKFNK